MSERKMQPFSFFETRRLLFCVVSFSVFLLFFSCFTLLKSSNSNSLIPDSVLLLMLPNNTLASNARRIDRKHPPTTAPQGVRGNSGAQREKTTCDVSEAGLKVYMYDLPPEFHFGLLDWKGTRRNQIWPDVGNLDGIPRYPGGLNVQHSVEYWLTLDLLASNAPSIVRPCTTIRVNDSREADVFFVPFFSSVSYNRHSKLRGREKISRNNFLQDKLVKFLVKREEWKRWGGKDHIILAHHPNSMLEARNKLGSAMFLLADFGRYPVEIANIKKDIVAPYVHVVNSVGKDSAPFEDRPTLVYFQGAIVRKDGGMIRQELYQLLKDEKDVHFTYGSARGGGIKQAGQGMASSKFCLNIAGDTPSSNRLFDAIVSHCVPVIISDDIELPFEDILDYSEFSVFVRASDSVKKGFLVKLLRGIDRDEWIKMWKRLQQIAHHFEYQYPSTEGDAVQMIWQAVARKLSPLRLKLNKERRYSHDHD
ncbi:uncharacterized protein A4U43_C03F450 [Asparagus officinalis]|uniref:Exostosin GT47 domain-containing protein n=1 Tax=Asparagus officinalis TaxID=4686 RepID=A0A5P1F806_ASPOF|nr:probable arabinosyltransferase ARAD1 [Asparagus officinalis]ONK73873.1 uncharacterized protein A4U43_C03F450 [Asparagus officinalis]